jgi:hypothetical protein
MHDNEFCGDYYYLTTLCLILFILYVHVLTPDEVWQIMLDIFFSSSIKEQNILGSLWFCHQVSVSFASPGIVASEDCTSDNLSLSLSLSLWRYLFRYDVIENTDSVWHYFQKTVVDHVSFGTGLRSQSPDNSSNDAVCGTVVGDHLTSPGFVTRLDPHDSYDRSQLNPRRTASGQPCQICRGQIDPITVSTSGRLYSARCTVSSAHGRLC